MSTAHLKPNEVTRTWYELDATGHTVGRIATEIAKVLMGKNKPEFSRHVDVGDFVIVTNVDKVEFRGNKWEQKIYYKHSLYPGGLRETKASVMKQKFPERILHKAVRGMLPKNKQNAVRLKRLKLYAADSHPHSAQQPVAFPELNSKSKR
jgi:large subunit ribosomal protein L13